MAEKLLTAGGGGDTCPRVGQLYISSDPTSPASIWANTAWEQVKDVFPLFAGDTYAAGSTGGNAEIVQTVEQMPEHTHRMYVYHDGGYDTMDIASIKNTHVTYDGKTYWSSLDISSAGGSQPMNIMPPYKTYYAWERIS